MKKLFALLCTLSSLFCNNNEASFSYKKLPAKIFGETPVDCIYLGMMTYHQTKRFRDRNDNWNNQAMGIQYKSIYCTTIINSHYKRCYLLGFTRDWFGFKPTKYSKITFGYRLGGIYGYGPELMPLAEKYPILPIYQLCSQVQIGRMRVEFSYFRRLISAYLTIVIGDY